MFPKKTGPTSFQQLPLLGCQMIPGVENVELFKDMPDKDYDFDVAIILDAPTLDRIGNVKGLLDIVTMSGEVRIDDVNGDTYVKTSGGEIRTGDLTGKVSLDTQDVTFEISDRGSGINEKDLIRIFDPFYRCGNEKPSKDGGVGLGLSLCKRIIEAHGGVINASSGLDRGTSISFSIPM